ncbi:pantetheine-phosphate adenylyltransferase [Methylopila sp. M107]|uniref:pantetheine-phosphate adenylyltransferase n=1 Tax=Methylopila sp. M107 TaxID=1101190 RepID=UPI000363EC86|nr:pantetheine-phosphate adenylyltransferase [Methylopila sp. M107]
MQRIAFYPGSFDPVTNGHLDVAARACRLADRLVVAIGVHHGKAPMFSVEERREMLGETLAVVAEKAGVAFEVRTFDGLVVQAARDAGASILVRGVRDGTDFDYEVQMAGMNAEMAPDVTTVLLPPSASVRSISATFVRQIASMGGDVSSFAPPSVVARLARRLEK